MLLLLLSCFSASPTPQAPPEPPSPTAPAVLGFQLLQPGLEWGVFSSPVPSPVGDSQVHVLRADPAHFELVLLAASELRPGQLATTAGWSEAHGLTAAMNASMFDQDMQTSVFYMQRGAHLNNPTRTDDAGSLLLADPKAGGPGGALLDVNCDPVASLAPSYDSQVQSWRLLDCQGSPTWREKGKIWSHALIGRDASERLLFIHARSPWSTRQFTEILQALPLEVTRLHYAEGGPEASLSLRTPALNLDLMGSYETGFWENDDNHKLWPLPNVVGLRPR